MKIIILTFFLLFSFHAADAQKFDVPSPYTFQSENDYYAAKIDVLSCIEWLQKTPLNQEITKRKEAEKFFMTWITGTPLVTIPISEVMGYVVKKNSRLLMPYFCGWTRLVLNSPDLREDFVQGNIAGIRASIEVYDNNRDAGIRRDKRIEKLKSLDQDGELETWVVKKLGEY